MREGGKSNVNTSTIKEFALNLIKYRLGRNGVLEVEPNKS